MKDPAKCSFENCKEIQDLLLQYVDGELAEGECTQLRARLAECPECATYFAENKTLKDMVKKKCGCMGTQVAVVEKIRNLVSRLSTREEGTQS